MYFLLARQGIFSLENLAIIASEIGAGAPWQQCSAMLHNPLTLAQMKFRHFSVGI
jgi:hypothetical protein